MRSEVSVDAVDDDVALLVLLEAVDAADQRRLAGARGAGDDDALAAHDAQVDVAQHVEIAVPLVHADDVDGDIGVAHVHLRAIDVAIDDDGFGGHSVTSCGRC